MVYEIYGIYNKINNKRYVGQTTQGYRKRFKQHLMPSESCPLFKKAVNKYGTEKFECELLDITNNQEHANELERMWIYLYKSYKPELGYNLSMGGTFGKFNEETRRKMSEIKKVAQLGKNNTFYGKHHSQESKKKMSDWKKKHYQLSNHPQAKKIKCVETGEVFNSVIEAALKYKLNKSHIGAVANKKYGRKSVGGYHWIWQ